MINIFETQSFAYAAGSRINVPLDILDRRGPNGGRLVIQRAEVLVEADLTTGAGVTLANADLHGILGLIEIRDAAGFRRYFTGEQAKLAAQIDMRHRYPALPAAIIANTANQLRDILYPIPFSRMNDFAPNDCAMPVDDLLNGGGITITWAATAALPWAGGTGTINSGTLFKVRFYAREEYDLVLHARDEISYLLQEAVATVRIPVDGNLLRWLYLHQGGIAGGGGDLAGITDATFQALNLVAVTNKLLKTLHLEEGGPVWNTADDMVNDGVALPLIIAAEREKMRDRPRINGSLYGKLTTTESVVASQVYAVQTPQERRVAQAALTVNGVSGTPDLKVKTEGKTATSPEAWAGARAFMPQKVKG